MVYEEFIDSAEAVTEVALDGYFLRCNSALCNLLGYSESELRNLRVREITHPDDRSHSISIVDSALHHHERAQEELKRYIHKDGRVVWVLLRTTLKRDSDGEPTHFLSFLEDASARIRNEPLARALARRLHTIQEQERQWVARELQDELGQLVAALRSELAWLAERLPKRLMSRAARLSQLTDGILSSLRRLWYGLRPTLLDELGLEAALDWLLQEHCGLNGIRWKFRGPEQPLQVDAQTRVALFRVCQQAMLLLLQEPTVTELDVWLRLESQEICLDVSSDGAPRSFRGQPGLLAIHDRVHLLEGKLQTPTMDAPTNRFDLCLPLSCPSKGRRRVPASWE